MAFNLEFPEKTLVVFIVKNTNNRIFAGLPPFSTGTLSSKINLCYNSPLHQFWYSTNSGFQALENPVPAALGSHEVGFPLYLLYTFLSCCDSPEYSTDIETYVALLYSV